MVPYGNRQNEGIAHEYPLKLSEGKYAITFHTNNGSQGQIYWNRLVNKISFVNNLYVWSGANQNVVGLLASAPYTSYDPSGNGYGMLYQDNYEDKPEIRVKSYFRGLRSGASYNEANNYNKNGNATVTEYSFYSSSARTWYYGNGRNQTLYTTYKTSTDRQYYGMLPVFSI